MTNQNKKTVERLRTKVNEAEKSSEFIFEMMDLLIDEKDKDVLVELKALLMHRIRCVYTGLYFIE